MEPGRCIVRDDVHAQRHACPSAAATQDSQGSYRAAPLGTEAQSASAGAPVSLAASRPGKKGKGKSKEASRASQTPKPKADWCTSFKGREICKRYQTGLCTSDSCQFAHVCACQFAHVCAIVNCQLKRPAMDHSKYT